MGELLVEVMRPEPDLPLGRPGPFLGPYPSGAPGIFIDAVARLGHSGGIVSGVGDDEFGRLVTERLSADGVRIDRVEVVPGRSTGVAFIAYTSDGSRSYIFHWAGTPAVMAPVPPVELADGVDFLHVMGCSLMADRARSHGRAGRPVIRGRAPRARPGLVPHPCGWSLARVASGPGTSAWRGRRRNPRS